MAPFLPFLLILGLRIRHPLCKNDFQLKCIKGGGACQLREKVIAEATRIRLLIFLCCSSLLKAHNYS